MPGLEKQVKTNDRTPQPIHAECKLSYESPNGFVATFLASNSFAAGCGKGGMINPIAECCLSRLTQSVFIKRLLGLRKREHG